MDAEERSVVGLTMLGHSLVHTYELSIPIFIPVWLSAFGLTSAEMGVLVAVGYACFGLGALPGGVVADRYGSRTLILACLLGMGVAFLGVSVAPSEVALAGALLVWGTAASVYHPAGLSLISRRISRRGTALGYHGMAGNVGIAGGPLATILLLGVLEWRTVAALLAVPALLTAALVAGLGVARGRPEATDGGVDREFSVRTFVAESRSLFAGGFLLVFGIVAFEGLFYRGVLTFLPDLLGGFAAFRPVELGSRVVDPGRYLYAGLLAIGVVGQYLGGRLTDRTRPARALVGVFAALAVVSLLYVPAARAGVPPLLVVSALLGVVLFGEQPVLQAAAAEYSGADVRGLSYGYMYVGVFGVGALGAAVTGVVLTYATPTVLFAVLAGFAVCAGLLAIRLARRPSGANGR